jgi:hypothetical protein
MKFKEAQKASIDYLQGSDFKSREDAITTIPSIPLLVNINRNGFITNNSQEGVREVGFNSKTYYEIVERAYVSGFMKRNIGRELIQWINTNTDKLAIETFTDISDKSWVSHPSIVVTKDRVSKTKAGLSTVPFNGVTICPYVLPKSALQQELMLSKISKTEDVIWIHIIDMKYGRLASNVKDGLYRDILAGLRMI